jgi:transposase
MPPYRTITSNEEPKLLKPKQKEQEDLLSPVLDKENLSAEEMLDEYKAQQSCERGFRFIKDPLFLADSVLVKTPKRIETMVFLMGI